MRGRRIIASVALFAIMLTAMFAFAPAAEAAKPPKDVPSSRPVYVALGDSLAEGLWDGLFSTYGYVPRYRDWLVSRKGPYPKGVELINLGKSGWTSSQLLGALTDQSNPDYARFSEAVKRATIITLDIGGNDMLQHRNVVDPTKQAELLDGALADFQLNWTAILVAIRELNPTAKLFAMNIYNPGGQWLTLARNWVPLFNDVIRNYTVGLTGALADVYATFEKARETGIDYISFDGIHPNSAGHKAIADCFIAVSKASLP